MTERGESFLHLQHPLDFTANGKKPSSASIFSGKGPLSPMPRLRRRFPLPSLTDDCRISPQLFSPPTISCRCGVSPQRLSRFRASCNPRPGPRQGPGMTSWSNLLFELHGSSTVLDVYPLLGRNIASLSSKSRHCESFHRRPKGWCSARGHKTCASSPSTPVSPS